MPRTKQPRFVGGVQLADNLYPDPRGRDGYWRYVRPDGSQKIFAAGTVEGANHLAGEANALRNAAQQQPLRRFEVEKLPYWVRKYEAYRLRQAPSLADKASWRNRLYALNAFARMCPVPGEITRAAIESWWDSLTHSQQILRQAEFRRFFNFLMSRGVVRMEYNPFTLSDDRPRLYLRETPASERKRLDIDGFWPIYEQAGKLSMEGLQIGMGISLYTTMRRGDVVALNEQNVQDGCYLRRTISKSEEKRGSVNAARLQWRLDDHPMLSELVERGRALGKRNAHDGVPCPYLVSHAPQQRRLGASKTHACQVLGRRLSDMFAAARDATGLWSNEPNPPTFHEVRSLGSALYQRAGYEIKDIQELMAHTEIGMTMLYQSGHELPHTTMALRLDESTAGRAF